MSDELVPIRCVTCNKILANLWDDYQRMLANGESIEVALNKLGLTRPCCRIRLRNPFKVVPRSDQTQAEVLKSYEENFDRLSYSVDPNALSTGALSAMTDTSIMIVPEEEDIEIDLPPIPTIPVTSSPKIIRKYMAW